MNLLSKIIFSIALKTCLLSSPAVLAQSSLDITLLPPTNLDIMTSGDSSWRLFLDGVIDSDAPRRVANILGRIPDKPLRVYLNSPGGNLAAGLQLGRLFREKNAHTNIGRQNVNESPIPSLPGICYSSCALAFLGGYYRFYSSESSYGVHRAWKTEVTDIDFEMGQILAVQITAYIREMGVDTRLQDFASTKARDQMYLLSKAEQEELQVVNNGWPKAEWILKMKEGIIFLQAYQESIYGDGEITFFCSNQQVLLRSIYYSGSDKAGEIVNGDWYHSLLLDGDVFPLDKPLNLMQQKNRINIIFSMNGSQTRSILTATNKIGHSMQSYEGAPFFMGYEIEIGVREKTLIKEYISNCVNNKI